MSRSIMSWKQENRIDDLIGQARGALNSLAEERLNLDKESRDALNNARHALAEFELEFVQQPKKETV